jgi:hypothetical protein
MINILYSFLGVALFYSLFAWATFIAWNVTWWGYHKPHIKTHTKIITAIIWITLAPILLFAIICTETHDWLTKEY